MSDKNRLNGRKRSNRIVPDTSVIINAILTDLIKSGKLKNSEIIIPELVTSELQAQASKGKEIGFKGLEEIKKLREYEKKKIIKITKFGRRQTLDEIKLAKSGRIDSMITDVAKEYKAVLYTCDYVQKLAAEAEGIETKYFETYKKASMKKIEELMSKDTMSLHLKENVPPMAKRGKPGKFKLIKVRNEPMTKREINDIISEINTAVRYDEAGFFEFGSHGVTVLQLGQMRISIARPPFSDGLEVTIVRPIAKVSLNDYKLSTKLKERLDERSDGILIAGPPGSGKSTFASSLAEFYQNKGKIVKTLESPRDLQVGPEITQYAPLEGDFEKTADVLLLVRPDYTIFDEIRKTSHFKIFSDLRLAGIGMVGVVHATEPIDAIQRFMGRVELGLIPHIIDTIIFIKSGEVKKVYTLRLVVRTPTGMTEKDLARPLVEVRDFETNELEYEIYTYGEENVVIPISKSEQTPIQKLAREKIYDVIKRFDRSAEIIFESDNRVLIKVDNSKISKLIGKKGNMIQSIENKLGMFIDIEPKVSTFGTEVPFVVDETGSSIIFKFKKNLSKKNINFYSGEDYIFSATVGRSNQIKVNKNSEIGKKLLQSIIKNKLMAFV